MPFNKKHFETRKAAKVEEAVEFDGFMPWSPENGLMPWDPENGCHLENEVTETSNDDTDDGLMPWGTPAQREAAEQALVRHFTY